MNQEELHAYLTLQHIPNLGDTSIKRLVHRFESPQNVLRQSKAVLLDIDGIGEYKLKEFFNKKHALEAEKELKFIETNKIECSCFQDANYPERLKHCIDGPILLFKKGKAKYDNPKIISIVGTRKVTTHAIDFIKKFIEELVPLNPLIVSGFAYGVDIAAHRAALDNGLDTLAIVAHGLNQIYPKVHVKYAHAVENQGAFVSDFWSSDNFDRTNFLSRNRIIAGISEATVVVESAEKGGSLVTADIANSYNRDVFAVPGRPGELTDEEKLIWKFLSDAGKEQLDLIALHCKMPIFKVSSLLLNMELKGVIRPLPGKQFELT